MLDRARIAPRPLNALAFPLLFVAAGCSSVGPEPDGLQSIGTVAEAFGESSCPRAPNQSFDGLIPDPGITTPRSYSNSRCYKSYVTEITNWSSQRAELVVTDPYVDEVTWHPAGSAPPPPSPPAISEADCNQLFLAAVIYENGVQIKRLGINGNWRFGECERPRLVFSALRAWWWIDPIDLTAGNTYTVAATYRTRDGSSAPTLPLKILTPVLSCGILGETCCPIADTTSSVNGIACEAGSSCQDGMCVACGTLNGFCCDSPTASECPSLVCRGGTCQR